MTADEDDFDECFAAFDDEALMSLDLVPQAPSVEETVSSVVKMESSLVDHFEGAEDWDLTDMFGEDEEEVVPTTLVRSTRVLEPTANPVFTRRRLPGASGKPNSTDYTRCTVTSVKLMHGGVKGRASRGEGGWWDEKVLRVRVQDRAVAGSGTQFFGEERVVHLKDDWITTTVVIGE